MASGSRAGLVIGAALLAAGALAAPQDEHRLGLQAYQRGDIVAAMNALRAPAAAGHAPSQTLLASILDRADIADEAARLYRAAADQGDAQAHAALAELHLAGRGVAKDEKQALVHFSKAVAIGGDAAPAWQARIDELKRRAAASGEPR